MQEFFTPDTLDELDRRVYDLAIQQMPLAEMAVRLGVPVPQADEKLQRLYSRLGVSDRATLRALSDRPKPPRAVPDDEFVIGADVDSGASAESTPGPALPRRFTRRRILTAGVVTGVIGASGAAALAFSRERARAPEAAQPNDQSPTPDPGGALPIRRVSANDGQFVASRTWIQGAEINWHHGIFFMSGETGAVTGYQFTGSTGPLDAWHDYRALGEGRFITANGGPRGESILFDRLTPDEAWVWAAADMELHAAYAHNLPATALFTTQAGANELRLHFVRLQSQGPLKLAEATIGYNRRDLVSITANRDRVAVFDGRLLGPAIEVFHLSSGQSLGGISTPNATGKEVSIVRRSIDWIEGVDAGIDASAEGFFLARWQTAANGREDILGEHFALKLDNSGKPVSAIETVAPRTLYAPNRNWSLTETAASPASGAVPSSWPSIQVSRGSVAEPTFRIRSASVGYGGTGAEHRWLADGTGFVAAVRAGGFGQFGYAIVRDSDSPIELLPPIPSPYPPSSNGSGWEFGPAASPYDAGVVSFSGVYTYNRRTERWWSATIAPGPSLAAVDPWSAGPFESVFALPGNLQNNPPEPLFLAPRFELPPFDDAFGFRVEVDAEGLSLRDAPGGAARVLGVLHDGDLLSLEPSPEPDGPAIFRVNQETWLHVATASGGAGWVNSYWLAWP